jgi:hypothetical protein
LSIQLVGHSPLRPDLSFAGHVSIALGGTDEIPPLPRFGRFVDQWFPVLLPERFVAGTSLQRVDGGSGAREVLILSLVRRDGEPPPPGLRADWEPSAWLDAVVETAGPLPPIHALIRGGCFLSPEAEISHWFGGRIGLDIPGFRARAAKQLARHAARGYAAWCFWLDAPGSDAPQPETYRGENGAVRIRHPVLGLAWKRPGETGSGSTADPGYRKAMDMLADAARIRVDRHVAWEKLSREDSPRLWQSADRNSPDAQEWGALDGEIRAFYRSHQALLARLAAHMGSPALSERVGNPLDWIAEFAAAALRGEEAA